MAEDDGSALGDSPLCVCVCVSWVGQDQDWHQPSWQNWNKCTYLSLLTHCLELAERCCMCILPVPSIWLLGRLFITATPQGGAGQVKHRAKASEVEECLATTGRTGFAAAQLVQMGHSREYPVILKGNQSRAFKVPWAVVMYCTWLSSLHILPMASHDIHLPTCFCRCF